MKKTATLVSWVCQTCVPGLKSKVKIYLTMLFLLCGLMFATNKSDAQCNTFNIDFKQAANRDNFGTYTTGELHWIGSILQSSNSRYVEGMSTLQRIVLSNLTAACSGSCVHTLRVKLQSEKSGNHAYDFITSWENALAATAQIAPGFGLMPANRADPKLHECDQELSACSETACNLITNGGIGTGAGATFRDLPVSGETNLVIPGDQNTTQAIINTYECRYGDRTVRVYAESFAGSTGDANNQVVFVGYGAANPNDGGTTYIYYDIIWNSCSPTVVIEFGAHIAVGVDGLAAINPLGCNQTSLGTGYFLGQGASDISGGPYHVIVDGFIGPDGTIGTACEPNIGNQDNQLQGSQVLLIPSCNLTGPPTACVGQTGLVYSTVNTNTQDATFLWQIIGSNQTTPASITSNNTTTTGPITVSAGSVGSYTVKFTITNGGTTQDTDDDIISSCTVNTTVTGGPSIVCPQDRTEAACQSQSAINAAFLAWLQTVTPAGASNNGGSVGPDKCGGTKTVIFTATNSCGTATCSATFTVLPDNTPPAFTGSYADQILGCNPANPDGSLGTASATDNCGSTTITSSDGAIVSTGCNRARTRTFTATDGCNNTATTSRTVRWIADGTPPVFTGSYADVNLGCNPPTPDGSLGTASATDGCGAVTITSSDGAVVSSGCNRSRTRTFTATDGCLNTATTSRTVRWIADLTPPSFTGSYADVILGCNPENPDGSLGTASATDACGPVTITSSDGAVVTAGCLRSRTRTFTATDGCLNTATTSRTVRWTSDLTPPVFTSSTTPIDLGCQVSISLEATLGGATATDACSEPTITFTDGALQSNGCSRSATRTYTARDACGNTASISRTVTFTFDPNPPVFTGSYADVNLGCNPGNPDGSLGSASATDGCGPVTITSSDGAVVTTGCLRSRTRTFFAIDACLNTASTSRTVRWIVDNTPPAFTGSYADVNLGCNPENPDGSLGTASATDACGPVTITSSDGGVQSTGCNRSRTRTFTATDACLNTATTSRTVRWIADLTPPSFTGSYADVNLGCNPGDPDGSLGTASATDACGPVTITSSDGAVVTTGCNRSRTRTFTATDGCLNTATTSRTVRWIVDLTPPSFTGSYADVNLGCNPGNPDGSLGTASATDACGPVTITSSDGAVVSSGCNRSRTRTFTATDGCLNTATTSRTVRWIADLTPPSFTGSYADVNLGCNPGNPDGSLGTASATDACGPVTITSSDGAVVSSGCNRSRTRTFTATDGCLNTATTSRTVRWIADLTPPSFTGSYADVNLGCNPGNPDGSLGTASATDACGPVTITSSDGAVQSSGCNRSRTRTFTATDGCLNTATTSRTVRWIADVTPPVFTGSYADENLGCNPANPDGSLGTASATDGCGPVTITSSDGAVQSNGCNRSRTRTFTATDGCLNTATTSRTVRWVADVTPPTLTCAADKSTACDGIVTFDPPTASDNCGTPTVTIVVDDNIVGNIHTRVWQAIDACGNTATCDQAITVAECGKGCTPGFWKNHTEIWDEVTDPVAAAAGFTTSTSFWTFMGLAPGSCGLPTSLTMEEAVGLNGGACKAIARHGVSALLGSAAFGADFAYPPGTSDFASLKAYIASAFTTPVCNCSPDILNALAAANSNEFDAEGNNICSALGKLETEARISTTPVAGLSADQLIVNAYPNPFTDRVRFVIRSKVSGQGSLEIYNMLGQKIETVYNGTIVAERSQTVEYRTTTKLNGGLIYIFRVGGKQVTGKLLKIDQ